MNARSKSEIRETILNDLMVIHNRRVELSNRLRENLEDSLSYVRELAAQLSQPSSGPLVPKTPKMRKRAVQRIETILEDEVFQQENLSPASSVLSVNEEERKESEVVGRRAKRGASKRAADNIKKQSFILSNSVKKVKRDSQIKRKKSAASSSDEDNDRISKYSRVEESQTRRVTRKQSKQIVQPMEPTEPVEEAKSKNTEEDDNFESPVLRRSSRASSNTASFKSSQNREVNNVNDAIVAPNADDVEEPSMYEDAIGKPVPVMNSTLKHSLLPLNATVVLERLPQQPKLNETVVIQKAARNSKKSKEKESSKKASQDVMQSHKAPAQYNDCDELITDDESSPEVKRPKKQLGRKQVNKKQVKDMLSTSSDDEIPNTPVKTRVRDAIAPVVAQESKTTYKSNALFSPYAKESVKKRVEAFEQAVMHSPKPKVDVDAPTRITRTKTRAMATAEMETETKNAEKSVAQILARKSLVKAKRISLAKQKKNDEFKEVKESVNKEKEQLPERINKLLQIQTDKINVKQTQHLKTTPLSKLKLMQPTLSVNRLHTPLNTHNLSNYSKTLTASRANIITNMESLIPLPKSTTKTNSAENQLDEKRRPEEDARKKREEALRLQTEEKRRKRQEKELKNKLAREAKEKQELEKRQRAEREREEKAKLALAMQEKQREEMERKRLAQLQRAQEKEERRKLEEQQKLQRLQEQEETERSLAEQRRREQEAEKRREAEARAQQAAAEALRQKNQLLAAQAKHKQQANNKHQGAAVSYVLDSEPDDDESDDESRPKHEIPHWAQAHVRRAQLAMQLHIPDAIVYKFFNTRKCTPDLTELFHGIDRSRLKRTSSAIWKTPPRISMMETEFVEPKLS